MNRFTPGNAIELVAQRRRVLPCADRGDRRRGARGLDRDLHLRRRRRPAARSPTRCVRAAQRGVDVRVLVDGWGARHYLTQRLERRACASGGVQLLKYRPEVAPWQFRSHRLRRLHRKLVPRRRQDRLRRRHQHHRRHEHAGPEAAAHRFRGARRGSARRARSCRRCSASGRWSSSCSSRGQRSAAVSRPDPTSRTRGHADGEVRDPRQPAPPARHRARVPRRRSAPRSARS